MFIFLFFFLGHLSIAQANNTRIGAVKKRATYTSGQRRLRDIDVSSWGNAPKMSIGIVYC